MVSVGVELGIMFLAISLYSIQPSSRNNGIRLPFIRHRTANYIEVHTFCRGTLDQFRSWLHYGFTGGCKNRIGLDRLDCHLPTSKSDSLVSLTSVR